MLAEWSLLLDFFGMDAAATLSAISDALLAGSNPGQGVRAAFVRLQAILTSANRAPVLNFCLVYESHTRPRTRHLAQGK